MGDCLLVPPVRNNGYQGVKRFAPPYENLFIQLDHSVTPIE